jgi:hypothetical protein
MLHGLGQDDLSSLVVERPPDTECHASIRREDTMHLSNPSGSIIEELEGLLAQGDVIGSFGERNVGRVALSPLDRGMAVGSGFLRHRKHPLVDVESHDRSTVTDPGGGVTRHDASPTGNIEDAVTLVHIASVEETVSPRCEHGRH